MLVSDLVNSRSIALAATLDARGRKPYLCLKWFPEERKMGLDLKWIKTHKGLPVSLAPSALDALPTLRAKGGLDMEHTKMAFFREQTVVDETDAEEIDRIQNETDPYLRNALRNVHDGTTPLIEGAEVVAERMRAQLLAAIGGSPRIGIFGADGVKYEYNYDPTGSYAANNYVKLQGTSMWSDSANAKPLTDLNNARKALQKKGVEVKYALMRSETFQYLLDSAQVKNAILAQNLTANIELTDDAVKSIVKARTKLTVVLYDTMYAEKQADGTIKEDYFYPADRVTLLPERPLGKTWGGSTPEERTARQVADVDVTIHGNGIAIAVKHEYGPPAITSVTASMTTLPSYEGMDSTYVLEVHSTEE